MRTRALIVKKISNDIQTGKTSVPGLCEALEIAATDRTVSDLFNEIIPAYMDARGLNKPAPVVWIIED